MKELQECIRWINWLQDETMAYLKTVVKKDIDQEDFEMHEELILKFEKAYLAICKMNAEWED